MDCTTCKDKQHPDPIPYPMVESMQAAWERNVRRLWIVILILIVLFVGTNVGWLIYESQFEDIYVEQEVDTGRGFAVVSGVGDIDYGESETDG